jgi:hypothetical protein
MRFVIKIKDNLRFAYIIANKEFLIHFVHYIQQDKKYMQGINLTNGKVGQFRTYQKDRIITKFDNESEANLYDLTDISDHAFSVLVTTNSRSKRVSKPKIGTFDINFTGFKQVDKDRLIKMAEDKKLAIR